MHVIYSPRYHVDIGLHVFPTRKYQLVHARLLEDRVIAAQDVIEPQAADWDDLALVHTREYLAKIRDGTLAQDDIAQLELPWSSEMVEGFRLMVGGTIEAARVAVRQRISSRTSVVAFTTPSPIMARGSVRSTTSPSRFACSSAMASSARR